MSRTIQIEPSFAFDHYDAAKSNFWYSGVGRIGLSCLRPGNSGSTGAGAGRAAKSKATRKAKGRKKAARGRQGAREGSKKAAILELLHRPMGATLKDIMAAAGWQAHSVRGFISGAIVKKMGLKVESQKRADGERA
ncbi:MAG: hypothetical protein A3J28_00185 [Acidobacteria bacterium RIFCSPLOWO2_12_FULL_60_22]|nr:MAG: hypothetical protein A3J28_00185 [Acidobacteria bacterium RIFCSPLOWO2_12_FULL_60_22]